MASADAIAKLRQAQEEARQWGREDRDRDETDFTGQWFPQVLHGMDLSGLNFSGSWLHEVEFNGADLSRCRFRHANLDEASLDNTNLVGADLTQAVLSAASLKGARLCEADLEGTIFFGAELDGADFASARAEGTLWCAVDLSVAKNLDLIQHAGPSEIGVETFVQSDGRIPSAFLEGCGLSDWEIEAVKLYDPDLNESDLAEIQYRVFDLRTRGVIQVSPVFISYSHADTDFVDALATMFDDAGVRYWRDTLHATSGRTDKVLKRGIALNPTLVLVLSEHSLASDWIEYEIDTAVQLSKKLGRDVLCPIALDDAWLRSERFSGNLRTQIKKYMVLDFGKWRDGTKLDAQFRKLLVGLGLHYGSGP